MPGSKDWIVRPKKKLFGCSPLPNFWKLEKFLLYKSILQLIFRIPKEVVCSLRIWSFKNVLKLLLSTCLHSKTDLKLVWRDILVKKTYLHLYLEIKRLYYMQPWLWFGKKSLGGGENSTHPHLLQKSCGGQPNIIFFSFLGGRGEVIGEKYLVQFIRLL